jgi:hypothetical protein
MNPSSLIKTPFEAEAVGGRWFILKVFVFARTSIGFQYQTIASTGPPLIGGLRIL